MATPSTVRRLAAAHRARPADYRSDLPGQAEFMAATERRVVWFGHNGGGKTEALARRFVRVFEGADMICAGTLRPLVMVLCVTGFDAVSTRDLARQLHDLCPPGLVAQVDLDEQGRPIGRASEWYGPAKGFRGRPPRLVVQRGPMRGTVLNITTLGSGTGAAAGGTIDLVAINEPVDRELLEELASRDRASALGYLWYVLTPIPGAPSQVYLERDTDGGPGLVEKWGESCRYIKTRLTPEALTFPSGGRLEPWAKTESRISGWSTSTRPMRMGESLEPLYERTYFSDVWTDDVIADSYPSPLFLVGSLDHGLKEGRCRIGVSGWQVLDNPRRLCGYLLAEIRSSSVDYVETARQFLRELDESRIPLEAIDLWIGDRAIQSDSGLVRRNNWSWRGAVLEVLRDRRPKGVPRESIKAPHSLWEIKTPRKRKGSADYGMTELKRAIGEKPPRLLFMRRCTLIVQDFQRWDGRTTSPEKDGLDMIRYAYESAHRYFGLWHD